MQIIPHQNINGSVIAVTVTATLLFSLVDTAASTSTAQAYFLSPGTNKKAKADGMIITPENGDIRVGFGSLVPTTAKGFLLSSGVKYYIPRVQLENIRFIRTGGTNVSVSMELGHSNHEDTFSAVAEKVELEATGDITIGTVKIEGDTSGLDGEVRADGVDNAQIVKFSAFASEELIAGAKTYIGIAPIGTATSAASWKILREEIVGLAKHVTWADGNENFDNVFDDAASLSYS